jgi:hypothetical protein
MPFVVLKSSLTVVAPAAPALLPLLLLPTACSLLCGASKRDRHNLAF